MSDIQPVNEQNNDTIRCRYCGQLNQTRDGGNGQARCGRCRLTLTGESAIRVIFTASAVKVTPKQCPDLYAKLQIACSTLGVDMPELFVQQNPIVNAFTGGVKQPIIVLHSALIERLTDEEILAVVAHEVGHIHAEHVLYITAARLLEALANVALAAAPIASL